MRRTPPMFLVGSLCKLVAGKQAARHGWWHDLGTQIPPVAGPSSGSRGKSSRGAGVARGLPVAARFARRARSGQALHRRSAIRSRYFRRACPRCTPGVMRIATLVLRTAGLSLPMRPMPPQRDTGSYAYPSGPYAYLLQRRYRADVNNRRQVSQVLGHPQSDVCATRQDEGVR